MRRASLPIGHLCGPPRELNTERPPWTRFTDALSISLQYDTYMGYLIRGIRKWFHNHLAMQSEIILLKNSLRIPFVLNHQKTFTGDERQTAFLQTLKANYII